MNDYTTHGEWVNQKPKLDAENTIRRDEPSAAPCIAAFVALLVIVAVVVSVGAFLIVRVL